MDSIKNDVDQAARESAEKMLRQMSPEAQAFYNELEKKMLLHADIKNTADGERVFTRGLINFENTKLKTFDKWLRGMSRQIKKDGHASSELNRVFMGALEYAHDRCEDGLSERYVIGYLIASGYTGKKIKEMAKEAWDVNEEYVNKVISQLKSYGQ